jgi:hypothetical protein
MMHRYFLIEPSYTDIDTFCNFTVGSGRVRANIQIYADDSMLAGVVFALTKPDLEKEYPEFDPADADHNSFLLQISVIPDSNKSRIVRFRVYQGMVDDDAPFMADIRFLVTDAEAAEFADDLNVWLIRKDYLFEWKP